MGNTIMREQGTCVMEQKQDAKGIWRWQWCDGLSEVDKQDTRFASWIGKQSIINLPDGRIRFGAFEDSQTA